MPDPTLTPVDFPIDPIAVAETWNPATTGLFQRFDLQSRKLVSSIVALDVEMIEGASLEAAIEASTAARLAGDIAAVLVFAGFEALMAGDAPADGLPPFLVMGLRSYLAIDHARSQAVLVGDPSARDKLSAAMSRRPRSPGEPPAGTWRQDVERAEYGRRVDRIRAAIRAGEAEGAVLSVELSKPTQADPFDIYRACVARNPSPYGFVVGKDGFFLVGSSPLSFARLEDRRVIVETDAGTRPVSGDAARDAAAENELKGSAKDATEHDVVVDAELAALATLTDRPAIRLTTSREVRRFSHVMHLYSVIEARLPDDDQVVSRTLLALAPAAAVSGKPKRAAARIGRSVEGRPRGPYGGIVGLIDHQGKADFAVVIRSLWISDGIVRLRVGGKIVAASDATAEYDEALSKARFLIEAVADAERTAF